MYRVVKKVVFEIVVNEVDGSQLTYEVAADNMPHALDMLLQWKPIAPARVVRAGPSDRPPVLEQQWIQRKIQKMWWAMIIPGLLMRYPLAMSGLQ
jgi:hypothetical protein